MFPTQNDVTFVRNWGVHGQLGESADMFCFDCVFIRELDTWSENFQKSFQPI